MPEEILIPLKHNETGDTCVALSESQARILGKSGWERVSEDEADASKQAEQGDPLGAKPDPTVRRIGQINNPDPEGLS